MTSTSRSTSVFIYFKHSPLQAKNKAKPKKGRKKQIISDGSEAQTDKDSKDLEEDSEKESEEETEKVAAKSEGE